MLENAFAGFKAQVQAVKSWVAFFELVDHAQTLQVVFKPTVFTHAFVECILSGVAERRVTQVVRQRNGFHQILVQAQGPGNRAAQLRDFERVREPRAEQIAFVIQEHLSFVDQPPKRGGVHDAVPVALESVARGRWGFSKPSTPAVRRVTSQRRQAGQWLA